MNYFGKRYLYNFLKEHGFEVPKMKEFRYVRRVRGDEILVTVLEEQAFDLFCDKGKAIYISVYERSFNTDGSSNLVKIKHLAYHLDNSMWIKHYEREKDKILVCRVYREKSKMVFK